MQRPFTWLYTAIVFTWLKSLDSYSTSCPGSNILEGSDVGTVMVARYNGGEYPIIHKLSFSYVQPSCPGHRDMRQLASDKHMKAKCSVSIFEHTSSTKWSFSRQWHANNFLWSQYTTTATRFPRICKQDTLTKILFPDKMATALTFHKK